MGNLLQWFKEGNTPLHSSQLHLLPMKLNVCTHVFANSLLSIYSMYFQTYRDRHVHILDAGVLFCCCCCVLLSTVYITAHCSVLCTVQRDSMSDCQIPQAV